MFRALKIRLYVNMPQQILYYGFKIKLSRKILMSSIILKLHLVEIILGGNQILQKRLQDYKIFKFEP